MGLIKLPRYPVDAVAENSDAENDDKRKTDADGQTDNDGRRLIRSLFDRKRFAQ